MASDAFDRIGGIHNVSHRTMAPRAAAWQLIHFLRDRPRTVSGAVLLLKQARRGLPTLRVDDTGEEYVWPIMTNDQKRVQQQDIWRSLHRKDKSGTKAR